MTLPPTLNRALDYLTPLMAVTVAALQTWPQPVETVLVVAAVLLAYFLGHSTGALAALRNKRGGLTERDKLRMLAAHGVVIHRHDLDGEVKEEVNTPDVIDRYMAIMEAKDDREGNPQ